MSEPFDYGAHLVLAERYLKLVDAAERLWEMWWACKSKADSEALYLGWDSTEQAVREQARWARDAGLLPLCWPGTRALDRHEGWPA